AGQFYPGKKVELQKSLQSLIPAKSGAKPTIAVMSPHAGYMYSGAIAGKTFAEAEVPDEIIILGPNHTGRGQAVSVYDSGTWETPLGKTEIATDLAGQIV
ncbi:MAG: AmmeMemoRadiSam system protein B, partial [Gammaproteobacteria bacterium]|nr:AmmeMemoRadiSam system protein B [Gammaproteobacteria bacterium]NIR94856.1 AmmeMemoRadiSam system protein B [Gammaproteobacteria bacterium]